MESRCVVRQRLPINNLDDLEIARLQANRLFQDRADAIFQKHQDAATQVRLRHAHDSVLAVWMDHERHVRRECPRRGGPHEDLWSPFNLEPGNITPWTLPAN